MTTMFVRAARPLALAAVAWLGAQTCNADLFVDVDFEDLQLVAGSSWNGPDPDGQVIAGPYGPVVLGSFESRGAEFVNRYDQTYGSWSGFAYSNKTNTTTPGYLNQFSAFAGSGHGPGADNYGVASGYKDIAPNLIDPDPFDPTDLAQLASLPYLTIPTGFNVSGLFVTNTTYAALSMLLGDGFAKKFGGTTGNDKDWFKLSAYATDASGQLVPGSSELFLADYRSEDNTLDYVVNDWRYLDLTPLAGAHRVYFNVSSSDVGTFGMKTPGNFALDDIRLISAVPEPSPAAMGALMAGAFAAVAAIRRRAVA